MRAIRTEEKDTTARPGGRLAEGALSRGEKGALLEAELRRCWIEQWGQRGTRFTQSRTLQTELCRDPSLTVAFLLYLDVARRGSDFLKDGRQTVSPSHTVQCGLAEAHGEASSAAGAAEPAPRGWEAVSVAAEEPGYLEQASPRALLEVPSAERPDALCLCKREGCKTRR